MIPQDDLFTATPQQLRRADQALADARSRRARQDYPQPAARRSDPPTSHAAAAMVLPNATESRLTVLRLLSIRPLTDFELAAQAGSQQTSIGKRRCDCMKAGWVRAFTIGGNTFTRPAPSGAAATVWEITDAGREFLRKATERA